MADVQEEATKASVLEQATKAAVQEEATEVVGPQEETHAAILQEKDDILSGAVSCNKTNVLPDAESCAVTDMLPDVLSFTANDVLPDAVSCTVTDVLPDGYVTDMLSDAVSCNIEDVIPDAVSYNLIDVLQVKDILPDVACCNVVPDDMSYNLIDVLPVAVIYMIPDAMWCNVADVLPDGVLCDVTDVLPDAMSAKETNVLSGAELYNVMDVLSDVVLGNMTDVLPGEKRDSTLCNEIDQKTARNIKPGLGTIPEFDREQELSSLKHLFPGVLPEKVFHMSEEPVDLLTWRNDQAVQPRGIEVIKHLEMMKLPRHDDLFDPGKETKKEDMYLEVGCLVAKKVTKDESVLVHIESNFDKVIAENEYALVDFYASWCGHCEALGPKYLGAAGILTEKESIILAKIDATKEGLVAEKFEVISYQYLTLKFFKNNKDTDYGGGRTANTIISWVEKKTGPAAEPLASLQKAKEYVTGAKAFLRVADSFDDFQFVVATAADVRAEYKVVGDAVVLIKDFDEPLVGKGHHFVYVF